MQASIDYSITRILREKLPVIRQRVTGYTRKLLLIWSDLPLANPAEVTQSLDGHQLSTDDLDAVIFIDFEWRSVSVLRDFAQLWTPESTEAHLPGEPATSFIEMIRPNDD